jgi:gas vesicle protein
MNKFFNAVLIGVGIGLLIAPMPGRDMRQLLRSRFQELTGQSDQTGAYQVNGGQQPSASQQDLKQTAETAMNAKTEGTLAAKTPGSYEPAYPEYVNPERTSNP